MAIRPMTMDDAGFLYECLKIRLTEPDTNISHTKMPTWEEHLYFLQNLPYVEYDIIVDLDEKIGYVYLTKLNEIGIFIMPEWRGQGYSMTILRSIMLRHPGRLLANISPGNSLSKDIFQKLGFVKLQETYVFDIAEREQYKAEHKIMTGE